MPYPPRMAVLSAIGRQANPKLGAHWVLLLYVVVIGSPAWAALWIKLPNSALAVGAANCAFKFTSPTTMGFGELGRKVPTCPLYPVNQGEYSYRRPRLRVRRSLTLKSS